jgi:hypothetical protein
MTNISFPKYEDFGSTNNLGKNLNDTFVFENTGGYSAIGFHALAPTGGEVTFEITFDDTTWEPVNMRSITDDMYTNKTDDNSDFVGSISSARKFRWRTSVPGSSEGTIKGRAQRGVSTLEGIEFGYPPHRFGFEPVHKDGSYTSAQTNTVIWTPSSGKKYVVTDLKIIVGGTVDGTLKIFDDTDASGNYLFKGDVEVVTNKQFVFSHAFITPFLSSAKGSSLKITTSANMTVDINLDGYEI